MKTSKVVSISACAAIVALTLVLSLLSSNSYGSVGVLKREVSPQDVHTFCNDTYQFAERIAIIRQKGKSLREALSVIDWNEYKDDPVSTQFYRTIITGVYRGTVFMNSDRMKQMEINKISEAFYFDCLNSFK